MWKVPTHKMGLPWVITTKPGLVLKRNATRNTGRGFDTAYDFLQARAYKKERKTMQTSYLVASEQVQYSYNVTMCQEKKHPFRPFLERV